MDGVVAVVVAAGSGSRLGGSVPKALRVLAGRPLVDWAVEVLVRAGVEQIAVVAPAAHVELVSTMLAAGGARVVVVPGDVDRQGSVRRGLQALRRTDGTDRVVLVHDAARPLVPVEVVLAVIAAVRAGGQAVTPVVPVSDTVRRVSGAESVLVDRETLRAVQTPQGFSYATLNAAHELALRTGAAVTDDIGVCELAGHRVTLVAGSPLSFKITRPLDLTLAEAVLAGSAAPERVSP